MNVFKTLFLALLIAVPVCARAQIPAGAAAAGFTTLALNADFTQQMPSGWLGGCATPGNYAPLSPMYFDDGLPHSWWMNIWWSAAYLGCQVGQAQDPTFGGLVLVMPWTVQTNYASVGAVIETASWDYNSTTGAGQSHSYPNNSYYEINARIAPLSPGAYFVLNTWVPEAIADQNKAGNELDVVETSGNEYWKYDAAMHNWGFGSGGAFIWLGQQPTANGGLPANYDGTQYHKFGLLVTANGEAFADGTSMSACSYIDDVFIRCLSNYQGVGAQQTTQRQFLVLQNACDYWNQPNGVCSDGRDQRLYVQSVRVYSCSSWQTTQCNRAVLAGDPTKQATLDVPIRVNRHGLTSGFFGMHVDDTRDWPSNLCTVNGITQACSTIIGARGKGVGVRWQYIEATQGVYNWAGLDGLVADAQAEGVSLFYSSDGNPSWVTCGTLASAYNTFYTALVNRYGANLIYEAWNEPAGEVQELNCSEATYWSAITNAHNVVRALAPTATLLTPSWAGTGYLSAHNYFTAGGTQDWDHWTVHIYANPDPGCAVGDGWLPQFNAMNTEIANWSTIKTKTPWMTEGANYFVYAGCPGFGTLPSDALKAGYIAQFYLGLWSKGVSRVYWYNWDNDTFGPICGTGAGLGFCYPVAITGFNQVENWMIGSSSPVFALSGTVNTVTMTQSGGTSARAVWDTAGSSSYTVPIAYGHYKTLAGATNAVVGGTVTIGVAPILLVP